MPRPQVHFHRHQSSRVTIRKIEKRGHQGHEIFAQDWHRCLLQYQVQIESGITAFLREPSARLEVQLSGKVQWQRRTDDQQFAIGFQFAEEVNWEIMGELFLSGILDQKTAV